MSSTHRGTVSSWFDAKEKERITVKDSLVRGSVFVCKLGSKVTEDDLTKAVQKFLEDRFPGASITAVKIFRTKNGVSKGYGFIELDDDNACAAIIAQKELSVLNRTAVVSEAFRKHTEELICRVEHVPMPRRDTSSPRSMRTESETSSSPSLEQAPSPPPLLAPITPPSRPVFSSSSVMTPMITPPATSHMMSSASHMMSPMVTTAPMMPSPISSTVMAPGVNSMSPMQLYPGLTHGYVYCGTAGNTPSYTVPSYAPFHTIQVPYQPVFVQSSPYILV